MIAPLIVLVAVAPVIAPERLSVETEETAPVLILTPLRVLVVLAVMVPFRIRFPLFVNSLELLKKLIFPVVLAPSVNV